MRKLFLLLSISILSNTVISQNQSQTNELSIDSIERLGYTDVEKSIQLYQELKETIPENTEEYLKVVFSELEFNTGMGNDSIGRILSSYLINQTISKRYQAEGYLEKGVIYAQLNKPDSAVYNLKKAIPIFESENRERSLSVVFKVIGNVLFGNSNDVEAIKYYKRAVKIPLKLGDSLAAAGVYNNMVRAYEAMERIDSAMYYNEKLLDIVKQTKNEGETAFMAYFNEADLKSQIEKYEEAESAIVKAETVARKLEVPPMIGGVYQLKCAVLKEKGDYENALKACDEALNIFESLNMETYYQQTLVLKYETAAAAKKFETAYGTLSEYQAYVDSISYQRFNSDLADLRFKYETSEKELKIAQQDAELIQNESERKTLLLVTIGLGLLIVLSLLFFRQRQKTQQQQIISLENEKENVALRSLMAGEEKERSRIAKELHDGLGGILAAAKMHASKGENLQKVETLLDTAAKESRRISHNLLPESLINKGLDQALRDFIQSINESGLIKAEYESVQVQNNLPQGLQLSIYRIIQELVNNIIKHAGASEALIQLQQQGNQKLLITVEDNGKGFAHETISNGIGLENIKSRLSLLKGKLDIDSQEKKGTSVYIELQLEK